MPQRLPRQLPSGMAGYLKMRARVRQMAKRGADLLNQQGLGAKITPYCLVLIKTRMPPDTIQNVSFYF
jgi:hypothetical protein